MPILMVALQSDKRSLLELSEIADLTVKEQLQTIADVSGVSIWGEKRYSMRLWLDPIKMSGYGITPIDVKNAVDKEMWNSRLEVSKVIRWNLPSVLWD